MPSPVNLQLFPVTATVDAILSYLHWVFGNPEITPSDYRWNVDDRRSKIRICAPFVIDNNKPMSAPFIVVERSGFSFSNSTLDNIKSSDANTFANTKKVDWADGYVNIICGSKVASEASNLANFLAIMFQADRHGIMGNVHFIRNLNYVDISPEIPVVKFAEVVRWEVTLRIRVSVQFGWIAVDKDPQLWNKAGVWGIEDFSDKIESETGSITEGSDLLVDAGKHFGYETTDDPQILEQELVKEWYYLWVESGTDWTHEYPIQPYKVKEIVNPTTLRLSTLNRDGVEVPWSAPKTVTGVKYKLLWNSIHLRMEIST